MPRFGCADVAQIRRDERTLRADTMAAHAAALSFEDDPPRAASLASSSRVEAVHVAEIRDNPRQFGRSNLNASIPCLGCRW